MTKISAERRTAGYNLLSLTDKIGFNACAAAWLFNKENDRWLYILVTPMIDSKGPKWVYSRLIKALKVLQIPAGIRPLDIHLGSPRDEWFAKFPFKTDFANLDDQKEPQLFEIADLTANKMPIDYMACYRMRPETRNAGEIAKAFDWHVNQLVA